MFVQPRPFRYPHPHPENTCTFYVQKKPEVRSKTDDTEKRMATSASSKAETMSKTKSAFFGKAGAQKSAPAAKPAQIQKRSSTLEDDDDDDGIKKTSPSKKRKVISDDSSSDGQPVPLLFPCLTVPPSTITSVWSIVEEEYGFSAIEKMEMRRGESSMNAEPSPTRNDPAPMDEDEVPVPVKKTPSVSATTSNFFAKKDSPKAEASKKETPKKETGKKDAPSSESKLDFSKAASLTKSKSSPAPPAPPAEEVTPVAQRSRSDSQKKSPLADSPEEKEREMEKEKEKKPEKTTEKKPEKTTEKKTEKTTEKKTEKKTENEKEQEQEQEDTPVKKAMVPSEAKGKAPAKTRSPDQTPSPKQSHSSSSSPQNTPSPKQGKTSPYFSASPEGNSKQQSSSTSVCVCG